VSPSSAAARRAAGFHRLSTSCAKGPFVALIWSFFLLELIPVPRPRDKPGGGRRKR